MEAVSQEDDTTYTLGQRKFEESVHEIIENAIESPLTCGHHVGWPVIAHLTRPCSLWIGKVVI